MAIICAKWASEEYGAVALACPSSRSVLELIPTSKSQMLASCLPAGYPQKIITYDEAQIPNVNFLVPACLKNNLRCPEFFRLNPLSQMFVKPAR